ncbi:MAG: hypothetical protein AB4040_13705 [Synechococcus sp.]
MTHPSQQLVALARHFYQRYVSTCPPDRCKQPLGVAVDRRNSRCSLIFKARSALLMHEIVIPLEMIQGESDRADPDTHPAQASIRLAAFGLGSAIADENRP